MKGLAPDDAALELLSYILAGEKNSRLTQSLVYQSQLASSVRSYQDGKRLAGDFWIVAMAKPDQALPPLQELIERELMRIAAEAPAARELDQAKNAIEADYLRNLETVNAKADALNSFYVRTGQADGFQAQLDRYRAVTPADIQRVAAQYLRAPRVTLSVVPKGRTDLAAEAGKVTP